MCLYSERRKPFIAKEDIVCYKVLEKLTDYYSTPYQNVKVSIPSIIKASKPRSLPTRIDIDGYGYSISDHAVHACISVNQAIDTVCRLKRVHLWSNYIVVEAIIPKGTEYWVNDDGDIAARRIELQEVCMEFESLMMELKSLM